MAKMKGKAFEFKKDETGITLQITASSLDLNEEEKEICHAFFCLLKRKQEQIEMQEQVDEEIRAVLRKCKQNA